MPVGDNQVPAHICWQQRVDKERKALNKQLSHVFVKQGILPLQEDPFGSDRVAPMHDLYRTHSTPALPAIAELGAGNDAVLTLPRIESSPGLRQGTAVSNRSARSAVTRSERSVNGSRRSRLSAMSGLTTESLRKEVADQVQREVAAIVQPLKQQLDGEQASRKRLEDMLRRAKGENA